MTQANSFNPTEYYNSYPDKVISRPGYPARAAFKSTLIWQKFGRRFPADFKILKYADIGGCFGFGANSLFFHIKNSLCVPSYPPPECFVYELSSAFSDIGSQLFPSFSFVTHAFGDDSNYFDLVSMFDVIEHIIDPQPFLSMVASRTKYALFNTPLETNGYLGGNKPLGAYGAQHPDGHVNFFTSRKYESLLTDSGFEIIEKCLVPDLVPPGLSAVEALTPEIFSSLLVYPWKPKNLSYKLKRNIPSSIWPIIQFLFGRGNHLSLCESRIFGKNP